MFNNLLWRLAYRLGYPVMQLWWRMRGARHVGAIVAVYAGGKILLLRNSYRATWNFPGGGVAAGESPGQAGLRELFEETGLRVAALAPAGMGQGLWNGRRETVHYFEARLDTVPNLRLDRREIIAARFVAMSELSGMNLTPAVRCYLAARDAGAAVP